MKTKQIETEPAWFVYIVACRDGTLYTGITNNLKARIDVHNMGLGAKYTRPVSRRPVTIAYSARCGSQSAAAMEEARIKKMSRSEKNFLLSNPRAVGAE